MVAGTSGKENEWLLPDAEPLIQAQTRHWRKVAVEVLDDCRQEARIVLWAAGSRLVELEAEVRQPYLQACVRNAFCHWIRRQQHHTNHPLPLEHAEMGPSAADELLPNSLAECLASEVLATAFVRLPLADRQLLDLAYLEERSDGEIAALIGISEAAAKKRRQRTLQRLSALLRATIKRHPSNKLMSPSEHPRDFYIMRAFNTLDNVDQGLPTFKSLLWKGKECSDAA
jgi:RNA polymerase sigma factor (sigma-70 family)